MFRVQYCKRSFFPITPHGDDYRWSDYGSGVTDTDCSSADLNAMLKVHGSVIGDSL